MTRTPRCCATASSMARRFLWSPTSVISRQLCSISSSVGRWNTWRPFCGARKNAASARQRSVLEQRLPAATYTELFGLDTHLSELSEVSLAPHAPWLVSVEGLGGSGKTAAGAPAIQRVAQRGARYLDFGWVSAEQQTLHPGGSIRFPGEPADRRRVDRSPRHSSVGRHRNPRCRFVTERVLAALEGRLREAPHLIVVDNLETVTDVETLLPTLARLAGPSKFPRPHARHFRSKPRSTTSPCPNWRSGTPLH